jgi:hypothetical protein
MEQSAQDQLQSKQDSEGDQGVLGPDQDKDPDNDTHRTQEDI